MKICFLILHYNEIELTKRAVTSIENMDEYDGQYEKYIVIVDNCSPNNSGKELFDLYKDSDAVHVILNTENGGFAKGNNIGYRYIRENHDADFVVALNNDITFSQKDFPKILHEIYEMDQFYLAGPDVYTPNIRSHISPLDASYKNVQDVQDRFKFIEDSINIYNKKFDFVTFTRYIQDKYQGSRLLGMYNKLRGGEYSAAAAYNVPVYGCVLNGACLIFDKRYIAEYEYLFDEITFLYAEEDFLTYRLVKQDKKIRYSPELRTDHIGQGSAGFGRMNYRQYCDKNIKTQLRCKESFEKYLDYISK